MASAQKMASIRLRKNSRKMNAATRARKMMRAVDGHSLLMDLENIQTINAPATIEKRVMAMLRAQIAEQNMPAQAMKMTCTMARAEAWDLLGSG